MKREFIRWVVPTVFIAGVILLVRLPVLFDPPYYDFCLSFWRRPTTWSARISTITGFDMRNLSFMTRKAVAEST